MTTRFHLIIDYRDGFRDRQDFDDRIDAICTADDYAANRAVRYVAVIDRAVCGPAAVAYERATRRRAA